MPVKSFSSPDLDDLERQINDWKIKKRVIMKNVSLATSASDETETFYALVLYSDLTDIHA